MSDEIRATHDAPSIDRDRGRRGRHGAQTRPRKAMAVGRLSTAAPVCIAADDPRAVDRVKRETTLIGALQLAEEGLGAAEESYRRVLAVLEGSLGEGHPEVADIHRWLSETKHARGQGDEAEYHARRALEIDGALGALPLRRKAGPAVRGLS
jgi:tetratricopeptide repeat protein